MDECVCKSARFFFRFKSPIMENVRMDNWLPSVPSVLRFWRYVEFFWTTSSVIVFLVFFSLTFRTLSTAEFVRKMQHFCKKYGVRGGRSLSFPSVTFLTDRWMQAAHGFELCSHLLLQAQSYSHRHILLYFLSAPRFKINQLLTMIKNGFAWGDHWR